MCCCLSRRVSFEVVKCARWKIYEFFQLLASCESEKHRKSSIANLSFCGGGDHHARADAIQWEKLRGCEFVYRDRVEDLVK